MSGKPGAKSLTTKEIEEAKTLSALGQSCRQIGRKLNRSDKTIKKYLTRSPEVIAELIERRKDLANVFEDLTYRFLNSISDSDIQKTPANQRMVSAGIAVDKMRLMRDQSTANLSMNSQVLAIDQMLHETRQKIAALAEELAAEEDCQ